MPCELKSPGWSHDPRRIAAHIWDPTCHHQARCEQPCSSPRPACSHPEYSALASSVLPQSLLAPWSDTGGEKCPCLLNISLGVLNSGESTTAIVQRACKTQIDLSCQTHTYVWKNCRSRRSCFQPGLMWRSQASIWVRVARCWTLLSLPEQAMVRARRIVRNPLWAVLFSRLYQEGRRNQTWFYMSLCFVTLGVTQRLL